MNARPVLLSLTIGIMITMGFGVHAAQAKIGPQIFLGRNTDQTGPFTAFRYLPLNGSVAATSFSTSTFGVFPLAGTFANMRVTVDTAPGAGASWVVTLMDSTVATTYTCTIGSAALSCTAPGTYSAAAGHSYSILVAASGATPVATYARSSIQFTPASVGHSAILGGGIGAGTVTAFVPFTLNGSYNTPESSRTGVFPEAGTMQSFYVSSSNPGGTASWTFTLRNAGGSTPIACTLTAATTDCSDLADSASIAANTTLDIMSTASGSPQSGAQGFGIDFVPSSPGDFVFLASNLNPDSTTAVMYYPVAGRGLVSSISATEASTTMMTQALTATTFSVNSVIAPGTGKSRTFTVRKNGADTALSCTIANTNTSCSVSGSVPYGDGDLIAIKDNPNGTSPAASSLNSFAIVANANTPSRKIRLFQGFKMKVLNGKMQVYQLSS